MTGRQFRLYFAWSRPAELGAELGNIDNRFPALFEFRRILWPEFAALADPVRHDQGIKGFVDDVILSDFAYFMDHIRAETGNVVRLAQRSSDALEARLDSELLHDVDTLVVVSLDHLRTGQTPTAAEVAALERFLADPDHSVIVCPHHDIGNVSDLPPEKQLAEQEIEYRHHGDPTIPPEQRFSGFGRMLLNGLGVPVENRFGLNPAKDEHGDPAPLEIDAAADRFHLLAGVNTFNLHPHLPHLDIPAQSAAKYDVLARQPINLAAPPHPFTQAGHRTFNALLQARSPAFRGRLLVCDATLWSSAFGGLQSLQRFWTNLAQLPRH